MTNQQAFDRVVRWFLVDGHGPSYDSSPMTAICMYRGPNGTRCGIGCLVDDKDYDLSWEEHTVLVGPPAAWVTRQGLSETLMVGIQTAHDLHAKKTVESFRKGLACSLRRLASKFLMSTDVLEAAIADKGIDV